MKMIRAVAAAGMLLAGAAAGGAPTQDTLAIAEAKLNRARVKTPPRFIKEGRDVLERAFEAERAKGHHGVVLVEAILDTNGLLLDPRIRVSSRAPELDRLALEAARTSILTPALDAAGTPIHILMNTPVEIQNRAYAKDGGVGRYRCGEFVQDVRWWRATWPERPWSDYEFYKLMRGFGVVRALSGGDREAAGRNLAGADFDSRWNAAQERCAAKPEARFVEVSGLMNR